MRHAYLQPAHIIACSQVVTAAGHIQLSRRTQTFGFRYLCAICYLSWLNFMQHCSKKSLHLGFPSSPSLLRITNPMWVFQRFSNWSLSVIKYVRSSALCVSRLSFMICPVTFWHSAKKPGAEMSGNPPHIGSDPTFSDS